MASFTPFRCGAGDGESAQQELELALYHCHLRLIRTLYTSIYKIKCCIWVSHGMQSRSGGKESGYGVGEDIS